MVSHVHPSGGNTIVRAKYSLCAKTVECARYPARRSASYVEYIFCFFLEQGLLPGKIREILRLCFLSELSEQINSVQQQGGIKSTRWKLKGPPVRNAELQTDRETSELPSDRRAADWNWLLHLLPFRGRHSHPGVRTHQNPSSRNGGEKFSVEEEPRRRMEKWRLWITVDRRRWAQKQQQQKQAVANTSH